MGEKGLNKALEGLNKELPDDYEMVIRIGNDGRPFLSASPTDKTIGPDGKWINPPLNWDEKLGLWIPV